MAHPSVGPDPDDSGESGPQLPEGVSADQVDSLIERVVTACEKIGLYANPMFTVEMAHDHTLSGECEKDYLVLHLQFRIGDVAWTKRVQDPEQDTMDDSFRTYVSGDVAEQVEALKARFRRKPDGEQPTPEP